MIKTMFTLVFGISTFMVYSQNQLFTYRFSIDTIQNSESSKEVLSKISQEFEMETKRITGKHQFWIQSVENVTNEVFSSKIDLLGYEVTSFSKTASDVYVNNQEKTDPGGKNCSSASIVCSNDSFNGTATGHGVQELNSSNRGCLSVEHQSSWYYVNIGTGGDLRMLIDPANNSDDYDFAIWGPFTDATAAANCPPTSSPARCSWSDNKDLTGMWPYWGVVSQTPYSCGLFGLFTCYTDNYGWVMPTDYSENAQGNSFVAPLSVNENEVYILLIDNYSSSGDPYNLTWGGSASLDCTPIVLPVDVSDFNGSKNDGFNTLKWSTATESGNDYFLLERSVDNENWSPIDKQSGAGYSTTELNYSFDDYNYRNTMNYYRLTQVDYNGKSKTYKVIAIDNRLNDAHVIQVTNMMGQEVDESYTGARIIKYSNGTILRKIGK